MKILLINNNPVVSRLTALSARKEDIEIDEIQEVTELNSDSYDIVFVDGDSWTKDVRDVISENIKVQKSVLFYADGEEDEKKDFDLSILKPFLPSEVSAVIRSVEKSKSMVTVKDETLMDDNHFNILDDSNELEKEVLFDLSSSSIEKDEKEVEDNFSLDEKDTFDTKLEEAFPLKINSLDDDLFEDKVEDIIEKKEEKEQNNELEKELDEINEDLFELDLEDENKFSLDNELFSEENKESSNDDLLDLDVNSNEIKLEDEENREEMTLKVEEESVELEELEPATKILDENEIENIKGLLSEDTSNDMVLEDLMPPMPSSIVEENKKEKKSKKESSKKVKESSVLDTNVLVETLTAMPVEKLRELLAGSKVKISIKFPKAK